MFIGIDARMYGPKQGGLGRYIQQLILNLESLDIENDHFVIFLNKENWDEYEPGNPHFKKVLADIPWYGLSEQIKLPRLIKTEQIDLMHFPHWNVPLRYDDPFVVTIHDLLLLHYPTQRASTLDFFTYKLKYQGYLLSLKHAAKKSKRIITVSNFSKADICKTLEVPAEKIAVTYLAPYLSESIPDELPEAEDQILLKKYNITKPYVIYVGVAYPHKNLEGLLAAWKIFEEKYSKNYQLVFVGKNNFFYDRLKQNKIINEMENKPIFTDFVSDSDLSVFYRHASLYVFPSFYEGFGLPPLEAMAYGVPIVAANATSLPEILKDAAHYFYPDSNFEIAKAMNSVLTDDALRVKLIEAGQKMYPQYSWMKLAKQTWEIYKNSV